MNFYFEAAKTLDRLDAKEGSIKGILATLPEKDRKRTAALVIETLKYKLIWRDLIEKVDLLKLEKKITSLNLALVLVHDLVLGKNIQAGDGPIKQAILRHKTRLCAEFTKIKIKRGVKSNLDLAQVGDIRAARIPRYVRVNTAMWNTQQATEHYISHGFTQTDPFSNSKGFSQDEHIPDLLLFSPQMSFQNDEAYSQGKVILQDKASCFPAVVLDPPVRDDAVVIDATAAPGNKTSHLSAMMQNKGLLYAFERDRKRFATLNMMLKKARCSNVQPLNLDFLEVDPNDAKYATVSHILLDPSCSGSGIVNRLDHLLETDKEEHIDVEDDRLKKLAAFQFLMIKHAMKFPSVQKIVYSTCSIHATENEHVVAAALKSEEASVGRYQLASPSDVLPKWHRRGLQHEIGSPDDALSLIRCSPGEDATNGFFVSCFIRQVESKKRKLGDGTSAVQEEEEKVPSKKKRKKTKKKTKSKASEPLNLGTA